jgi:putative resolvase
MSARVRITYRVRTVFLKIIQNYPIITIMDKMLSISEAANTLGVSTTTLRRWEEQGKLLPDRTHSGHRRYRLSKIKPEYLHSLDSHRRTIAYTRVSSHD